MTKFSWSNLQSTLKVLFLKGATNSVSTLLEEGGGLRSANDPLYALTAPDPDSLLLCGGGGVGVRWLKGPTAMERAPEMLFPDLEPIQAVEVVDWLAGCGGMHLDSVLPAVLRVLRAIPLALATLDAASKGEEIEERDEEGEQLLAKLSALTDALVRFVRFPHGDNNPLNFTMRYFCNFTLCPWFHVDPYTLNRAVSRLLIAVHVLISNL